MRHFKQVTAALLLSALALGQALAQTPAPATPPAASAPAATQPAGAKPKAKEVRAACRDEAKAQGLKGAARKAAVQGCFVRERPDLAKRNACRDEGKAKSLAGKELKGFVKQCAKAQG